MTDEESSEEVLRLMGEDESIMRAVLISRWIGAGNALEDLNPGLRLLMTGREIEREDVGDEVRFTLIYRE